jgi:hypothetical protein
MKGNDMSLEMEQMNFIESLFDDFDSKYDSDYSLQDLHMEYIMENCHGERVICNGDTLVVAQEEGYLYEEFREEYIEKQLQNISK